MLPGHFLLTLAAVLLLMVPRRYAAAVFLTGAIFIPMGITLTLGNLNFFPIRVLALSGLVRIVLRSEWPRQFPTRSDRYVIAFGIICLLSSLGHNDPRATFIYNVGTGIDALGAYFLFRAWVREWDEVVGLMRLMLVLAIPLVFFMAIEYVTHRNLFSYVGGIPIESAMREGSVRARGPFRHSILAGTYGALCLPIAVAFWRRERLRATIGVVCSLAIVFFSTSGGPLMTLASVILALILWRYRVHLRTIIRSCIVLLLILHFFVMKAPVWYLMARIDVSGNAWHRAKIIDSAIKYFHEWWLAGTDVTRHWMPYGLRGQPDACDITNQYIGYGVRGGIFLMLAFALILGSCFKQLSAALRSLSEADRNRQFAVWCLGCVLFGHVYTMFGVNYYDQSIAVLYSFIGLVAGATCWTPITDLDQQEWLECGERTEPGTLGGAYSGAEIQRSTLISH
jgi:hypothetical protein